MNIIYVTNNDIIDLTNDNINVFINTDVIDLTNDYIIDLTNDKFIFETFNQVSKRMAFYAGVWKNGKFTIPLKDAIEYGKKLPFAIEFECLKIDCGISMSKKLTPFVVNELINEALQIKYNNVNFNVNLKYNLILLYKKYNF